MSKILEMASLRERIAKQIREGVARSYMQHRINEDGGEYVLGENDTHFAVHKPSNKIVFSWDYADIDPVDLRNFRKDYFTVDVVDNGFNPNEIVVLNRKSCIHRGIDPSDSNNWSNNPSVENAEPATPEPTAEAKNCAVNEASGRFAVHVTGEGVGQSQFMVDSLGQLKQCLVSNYGEDFANRINYIDICHGNASNLSEPEALIAFGGEGGYWANVAANNPKVASKRKDIKQILGI